jgi:supervillin
MTSLYGQFEAKEIMYPLRSSNVCHFPFYQFQLYEEKQPAIFLFDNNNEIYVWQGWFESSVADKTPTLENDAVDGTARIRFNVNRKCALQTAINYWKCKHKNGDDKAFRGFLVYAGLDPVEFTNLFQLSKQINIWLLLPIAMFLGFELTLMWFEFYRVYFF